MIYATSKIAGVWLSVRKLGWMWECGWRWGSAWWRCYISDKFKGNLQLDRGAAVSLPAWFTRSSGQETATVSAVSLMANEFPGAGWWRYVYVCVDGCLDM